MERNSIFRWIVGACAVALTVSGASPAHAEIDAPITAADSITQAGGSCAALIYDPPPPLGVVGDALPVSSTGLPALDKNLFSPPPHSVYGCPARVDTQRAHARSDASADALSGRWATSVVASTADSSHVFAHGAATFLAGIDARRSGNLSVHLADVVGTTQMPCDGCDDGGIVGGSVYIDVNSDAGDFWVFCGLTPTEAPAALTLPDETHCGLDRHGKPFQLPVAAGGVVVNVVVESFATVGDDRTPPAGRKGSQNISGRLRGFDITSPAGTPEPASTATNASTADVAPAPVPAPAAPVANVTDEPTLAAHELAVAFDASPGALPKTGGDLESLVAIACVLGAVVTVARRADRGAGSDRGAGRPR